MTLSPDPPADIGRPFPLLPQHLTDLKRSGLSDTTIAACEFRSLTDPAEIARVLNWQKPAVRLGPCLGIPFFNADGSHMGYVRAKPDVPPTFGGKPAKYLSPKAANVRVYFPPRTREKLSDVAVPLVLTEGEKKCAKADQEGFACVGLVGVDCWSAPRGKGLDGKKVGRRVLHPDLAAISWVGREVTIVFDSDAAGKSQVRRAEKQLADALHRVGAKPKVIRLPAGPGGVKCGLDDYLLANGPDALRALIAESAPPPGRDFGGGDGGPAGGDKWVRIEVTPRQYKTNDAVLHELPRMPDLYQRGDMLVRVAQRAGETKMTVGKTEVTRPPGPVVQVYDACSLGGDLTRFIDFFKVKATDEGTADVPAHPPVWAMNYVLKRKHWPGVPGLAAVVTYPVILPDGRVITAAGYDRESGVYLDGDFAGLPIPDRPTRADAGRAAAELADLVGEFEWEQPAHTAAWVMATVTPLARHAYAGPTPLFLYEANTPGAGKTLLTDVTAEIVTGRPFSKCSYPTGDPREVDKLMTSFAVAGDSIIQFDNVAGRFGDPYLDKVLTGTEYEGRVLGESRTWRGSFAPVIYATGNNCELASDLSRRVVPIKLFTEEEFPDTRGGYKYVLPAHARENRSRYLSAALTILKAYIAAGFPSVDGVKPFGSFGGWAGLVRNAVVWAGMADISEAQEQTRRESDRDRPLYTTLLAELRKHYPDGTPFTLGQVAKTALADGTSGWEAVAEVLNAVGATDTVKLGYRVRNIRGRNFGGLRVDHYHNPEEERRTRGGVKWAVVSCVRKSATGKPSMSSPSSHRHPGGYVADSNGISSSHRLHTEADRQNVSNGKAFRGDDTVACDDGDDGAPLPTRVSEPCDDGCGDAGLLQPPGPRGARCTDQMLPD
jgi:hypothetical protein